MNSSHVQLNDFFAFMSLELHKVLGPVTEQLNTSIAQKLTATDQLMKENIHKLVKSKVRLHPGLGPHSGPTTDDPSKIKMTLK